jgi:hypothetical protein
MARRNLPRRSGLCADRNRADRSGSPTRVGRSRPAPAPTRDEHPRRVRRRRRTARLDETRGRGSRRRIKRNCLDPPRHHNPDRDTQGRPGALRHGPADAVRRLIPAPMLLASRPRASASSATAGPVTLAFLARRAHSPARARPWYARQGRPATGGACRFLASSRGEMCSSSARSGFCPLVGRRPDGRP